MILNLDPSFTPFGQENAIAFKASTFPRGEPHIRILSDLTSILTIQITHRVQSFNDFGLVLLAIDALKRLNIDQIKLFIPYFPGARQDRVMNSGEGLTVKLYTDILNAANLKEIQILDPHSAVTTALLNRCKPLNNFEFIDRVIHKIPSKNLVLVSPDGGALKKIHQLATHLKHQSVVECSKVRNLETGKLSHFNVYTTDLKGQDCLIVDDICDGGGTFIGLAKALKEKNAGKLYLAVSHGIFSKGLNGLNHLFEQVYTTNSFKTALTSKAITHFPIQLTTK